MNAKVGLTLGALWLSASACTITGLPADKAMNSLTQEEALQACESSNAWVEGQFSADDRHTFDCNMGAILAGALGGDYTATCTEARDSCLAEEPESSEVIDCGDDPRNPCTGTVAQYEACLEETIETLKKFNAEFTCDAPPEEEEDTGEKTACQIFEETCGGDA